METDVEDRGGRGRHRGLDIDEDEFDKYSSKSRKNEHPDPRPQATGDVSTSGNATATVEELLKRIDDQTTIITKLESRLAQYEKGEEFDEESTMKKRKRDGKSVQQAIDIAATSDSHDKDIKIRMLSEKVADLEKKLSEQKKKTTDLPLNKPTSEVKTSRTLPANPTSQTNFANLLHDLQNGVKKHISDIQTSMQSQMLEMKVSLETAMEGKIANALEKSKMTYASCAATGVQDLQNTQGITLNSVIETKNAEMVIEYQRQRRENNIIVHGVSEDGQNSDEQRKIMDETYISELFQILGVNVKPSSITRLGKLEINTKNRPIKIVMENTSEKDLVMSRLSNLKTAEDKYKKISVKDDYTPEERTMIRSMNEKAIELNKSENTTEWKIRGSPKNGLRLVKIKAKHTVDQLLTSNNVN